MTSVRSGKERFVGAVFLAKSADFLSGEIVDDIADPDGDEVIAFIDRQQYVIGKVIIFCRKGVGEKQPHDSPVLVGVQLRFCDGGAEVEPSDVGRFGDFRRGEILDDRPATAGEGQFEKDQASGAVEVETNPFTFEIGVEMSAGGEDADLDMVAAK